MREEEEPLWLSCLYMGLIVAGIMMWLAALMIWLEV